jgi:hypothetical protein
MALLASSTPLDGHVMRLSDTIVSEAHYKEEV